uniref:Uncharacterized protein n=1 Tax=Oryza punctata TaxID=4537 RepID=A0A0E0MMU8_ORYPU
MAKSGHLRLQLPLTILLLAVAAALHGADPVTALGEVEAAKKVLGGVVSGAVKIIGKKKPELKPAADGFKAGKKGYKVSKSAASALLLAPPPPYYVFPSCQVGYRRCLPAAPQAGWPAGTMKATPRWFGPPGCWISSRFIQGFRTARQPKREGDWISRFVASSASTWQHGRGAIDGGNRRLAAHSKNTATTWEGVAASPGVAWLRLSSDEMWMYAPLAFDGGNNRLYQNSLSQQELGRICA